MTQSQPLLSPFSDKRYRVVIKEEQRDYPGSNPSSTTGCQVTVGKRLRLSAPNLSFTFLAE